MNKIQVSDLKQPYL